MRKFKTGLIIGRFQPFHLGHLYLLEKALEACDKLIIAIGSSNVTNDNNPLSYEARREMIKKVIKHENLENRILKIVPSPDDPSDEVWLKLLLEQTGPFDVEIGEHDDTTNPVIKEAGFKTLTIPYKNRDIYQGVHIRGLQDRGESWQDFVPGYLVAFIQEKLKSS